MQKALFLFTIEIMKIPDFETLDEAKQFLRENWEKGTACPCCGQFVKLYKRKLNSSQAHALILFYNFVRRKETDDFVHVNNFHTTAFRGGEFAKLRYWGLIEGSDNDDTTKKDSGLWKITAKGIRFAEGESSLPKRVHLYNGKIVGWSEERMEIKEALGDKFDYEELMNS